MLRISHEFLQLVELKRKSVETLDSYANKLNRIEELTDEKEKIFAEYEFLKCDYQRIKEKLESFEGQVT